MAPRKQQTRPGPAASLPGPDLYSELGLARNAGIDDIKRAYRRLALQCHPDKCPGDDAAHERFQRISMAYSVLSDPQKRRYYDQTGTTDGLDISPDEFMDMFQSLLLEIIGGADMIRDMLSCFTPRELARLPPFPFPKELFPPGTFPPGLRFSSKGLKGLPPQVEELIQGGDLHAMFAAMSGMPSPGGASSRRPRAAAGSAARPRGAGRPQPLSARDPLPGFGGRSAVHSASLFGGLFDAGAEFDDSDDGSGSGGSSDSEWTDVSEGELEAVLAGQPSRHRQDTNHAGARQGPTTPAAADPPSVPWQPPAEAEVEAATPSPSARGPRPTRDEKLPLAAASPAAAATALPGGNPRCSSGEAGSSSSSRSDSPGDESTSTSQQPNAPPPAVRQPQLPQAPALQPQSPPQALLVRDWMMAARSCDLGALERLLAQEARLLGCRGTGMGHTALHWCAAKGSVEGVCWLLRQGVDVNVRNDDGATPLHAAARNGRLEAVEALLSWSPSGRGNSGARENPGDVTATATDSDAAAAAEAAAAVASAGLGSAASASFASSLCDLAAVDGEGRTALALALEFQHVQVAALLLRAGAARAEGRAGEVVAAEESCARQGDGSRGGQSEAEPLQLSEAAAEVQLPPAPVTAAAAAAAVTAEAAAAAVAPPPLGPSGGEADVGVLSPWVLSAAGTRGAAGAADGPGMPPGVEPAAAAPGTEGAAGPSATSSLASSSSLRSAGSGAASEGPQPPASPGCGSPPRPEGTAAGHGGPAGGGASGGGSSGATGHVGVSRCDGVDGEQGASGDARAGGAAGGGGVAKGPGGPAGLHQQGLSTPPPSPPPAHHPQQQRLQSPPPSEAPAASASTAAEAPAGGPTAEAAAAAECVSVSVGAGGGGGGPAVVPRRSGLTSEEKAARRAALLAADAAAERKEARREAEKAAQAEAAAAAAGLRSREEGRSWLEAARRGELAALQRMLADNPRLLSYQGQGTNFAFTLHTALHWAVAKGHTAVATWLLQQGADPDAPNAAGATPLHAAASGRADDCARLLVLQAAAKMGVPDCLGETVRDILLRRDNDDGGGKGDGGARLGSELELLARVAALRDAPGGSAEWAPRAMRTVLTAAGVSTAGLLERRELVDACQQLIARYPPRIAVDPLAVAARAAAAMRPAPRTPEPAAPMPAAVATAAAAAAAAGTASVSPPAAAPQPRATAADGGCPGAPPAAGADGTARDALQRTSETAAAAPSPPAQTGCDGGGDGGDGGAAAADAAKQRGNEAFSRGDFPKAVSHYTMALRLRTEPNAVLYSNRSAAYSGMSYFGKAQADAEEAVRLDSQQPKYRCRLGVALLGQLQLREAEAAFRAALKLNPAYSAALQGLEDVRAATARRTP